MAHALSAGLIGILMMVSPPGKTDGVKEVPSGPALLWTRLHGGANEGVPLVFVHGGPGMTSFPFEHTIGPRLARSRSVVYTDYRGAGRSSRPEGIEHYSFEILAGDLERIRVAYGFDRVVVLGHSNGCATALTYARLYPNRVAALVLVAPLLSPLDLEVNVIKKAVRASPEARARVRAILQSTAPLETRFTGALDAVPAETRQGIQFADPANQEVFDDLMGRLREETGLESVMTPDLIDGLIEHGFFEFDAYTFVDELTMPVLVATGTRDSEVSVENSARFSLSLADGSFLELEHSGHHPFVEQPEELSEGIESFLEEKLPVD